MKLLGALGIDWKILLIQSLNFLVLFLILKWLFFKPFIAALKRDKKKIEEIHRAREEIQRKREEMEKEEEKIIQEAKKKAREIIQENERITEKEREEMVEKIEKETRAILKRARERARIEAEKIKKEEKEEILKKTKEILKEILSKSFTNQMHRNLVKEIIEKLKRTDFSKVEKKEIVLVRVVSAQPLEKKEKKEISDLLFEKLKNPAIKSEVNPNLIAGIKLIMGEFLIDESLASKIEKAV